MSVAFAIWRLGVHVNSREGEIVANEKTTALIQVDQLRELLNLKRLTTNLAWTSHLNEPPERVT